MEAVTDWDLAIEINRAALKRIVAMLVAMAGFAGAAVAAPTRQSDDCGPLLGGGRRVLPRHLHRAVLRLLRPAESAARRLVIAAAREMLVVPVRSMPGGAGSDGLRVSAGVCVPPPLTPPRKGEGVANVSLGSPADAMSAGAAKSPSPLRGSEGRRDPWLAPARLGVGVRGRWSFIPIGGRTAAWPNPAAAAERREAAPSADIRFRCWIPCPLGIRADLSATACRASRFPVTPSRRRSRRRRRPAIRSMRRGLPCG